MSNHDDLISYDSWIKHVQVFATIPHSGQPIPLPEYEIDGYNVNNRGDLTLVKDGKTVAVFSSYSWTHFEIVNKTQGVQEPKE